MINDVLISKRTESSQCMELGRQDSRLRLSQRSMWRNGQLEGSNGDFSWRSCMSLIAFWDTNDDISDRGTRKPETFPNGPMPFDQRAVLAQDLILPSSISHLWLAMELLLMLAALASLFYTTVDAQFGRKQFPGEPPYRPFPPYRPWPHKRPCPPPPTTKQPVYPQVKTTPQILGLANDPALDRDSCGSMSFVDRTFWTCRDTQLFYPNGSVMISPLITSTASWSDFSRFGGPKLEPIPAGADPIDTTVLRLYGNNSITQAFYPILPDYCDPPSGACPDGTRYALCEFRE